MEERIRPLATWTWRSIMKFMGVLSCLSLLLAAAAAQVPEPCVSPPVMTGLFAVMAANVSCSGQISYDTFSQRIRVRSTGAVSNETFFVDQLMLFRQKVYYEIDWLKTSCKKKPLDTAFIPMQVPFDAHADRQMFLGSSASWGMGVLVNNWSGKLPNNGYYTGVFTEIGCIPMTFFSYMPTSGWSMISTFNWVLGNTNPMDFAPPSFCAKSKLEVTETPDNMFTALQALALKTKRGD